MTLSLLANLAAILTALVAVIGYGFHQWSQWQKRVRLENYLKSQQKKDGGYRQQTIIHLMAKVGLTEAEILQASFKSKKICRLVKKDKATGLASHLLFQWSAKPNHRSEAEEED